MATPILFVVGDVLVPKPRTAWGDRWSSLKLVSERNFKGHKYWWCEMTSKDGLTHLDTLSNSNLAEWQKESDFFMVDATYKFEYGREGDTWTIMGLYQVDNPHPGAREVKALAKMIDSLGYEDIQTLSEQDFIRMVRV